MTWSVNWDVTNGNRFASTSARTWTRCRETGTAGTDSATGSVPGGPIR